MSKEQASASSASQPSTISASSAPAISACIIARDEAHRLPDCLASVAFCDEVVVVDSGSTDATVKIAVTAGARVIEQPWLGFSAQRNVALDHARGDWVLEIDADERVTPALSAEIVLFLADPDSAVDMGALPLRNVFLGRPLGPSAKYPEYRRRLIRRGAYRHDEDRTVHEALVPHGSVHPFTYDLEHLLAENLREALADAWRYARLEAGQMQSPLTFSTFARGALIRPPTKFVYRLLVDGGWRDGWRGMGKIAIDCAIDMIVWFRHLLGRRGERLGHSGVQASVHYGATNFRAGAPRVVGVASGHDAHARAVAWLEVVGASGADVVLLSDTADCDLAVPAGTEVRTAESLRVRRIPRRMGPLALIRALDAEEQLRTIDSVIAFGPRARRLLHAVPPGLRGAVRDFDENSDPQTIWRRVKLRLAGPTRASGDSGPLSLGTSKDID
jgi:glycosyltransferase involved in cell wall biosynthesis